MDELQKAATYLAAHDPVLAPIIATAPLPGFRAHTNYYQALVNSIIGQQLSVKAAATIKQRFAQLFGEDVPQPGHILAKSTEELRSAGLSKPKAAYIQDLARHIQNGTVRFDTINSLSNEEIITELTQVKGIGEWTAHMFLLFCMARLDVLPVGDLGVRVAVRNLYGLSQLPAPDDIRLIAKQNAWTPYESVASWYLWRSLENEPAI